MESSKIRINAILSRSLVSEASTKQLLKRLYLKHLEGDYI